MQSSVSQIRRFALALCALLLGLAPAAPALAQTCPFDNGDSSLAVDGVILTVADASASGTLDVLDREGIPYVLTYNQPQQASRLSVSVDNRAAARDAVAHLIALGHTRIQMLTGQFNASDRAIQRYHGYLDAMRAHGLAPMTPIEVPRHTGLTSVHLQPFADPQRRPSALFCSNDLLALAAMRDLRELGLRVPEDISVMGFDGIPLGEMMSPVLASAVQPSEQIGEVALRTLVAAIGQTEGAAGPVSQTLAHTIRPGGTVMPVFSLMVLIWVAQSAHSGGQL